MLPTPATEIARQLRAPAGLAPEETVTRAIFDHREARSGDLFFGLRGQRVDGGRFAEDAMASGATLAVRGGKAAFDGRIILVPDVVEALARVATAMRARFPGPVVAITGSMGKTTVKDWLAQLSAAVARTVPAPASYNNLEGVSRSILAVEENTERLILELGTSGPGEIGRLAELCRPTHAVLTAIGPAHLEGLGDLEGVLDEKTSLAHALEEDGVVFVNADDPMLARWAADPGAVRARIVKVSLDPERRDAITPAGADPGALRLPRGEGVLTHSLRSEVQVRNLWLAYVVARELGGEEEALRAAAATCSSAALRGAVQRHRAAEVIVDCYNANPISVLAAARELATGEGERTAVLGDMRELGESSAEWHERVARQVGALGLERVWFIGEHGMPFAEHANARLFPDVEAARRAFAVLTQRPGRILLKASRALALERLLEEGDG